MHSLLTLCTIALACVHAASTGSIAQRDGDQAPVIAKRADTTVHSKGHSAQRGCGPSGLVVVAVLDTFNCVNPNPAFPPGPPFFPGPPPGSFPGPPPSGFFPGPPPGSFPGPPSPGFIPGPPNPFPCATCPPPPCSTCPQPPVLFKSIADKDSTKSSSSSDSHA